MIKSICVENGRIFIEGKETVDPLMIGYSVLDALENGFDLSFFKKSHQQDKITRKQIITDFMIKAEMRKTYERDVLIELVSSMDKFKSNDFIEKAKELNICRATAYNFINILVKAKIIQKTNDLSFN